MQAKRNVKTAADSYILSAPNGHRTLTHRAIEKAMETIFRRRERADG